MLVGANSNQTIFRTDGNDPAFRITSSDVMIANMKINGGNGYGIELIDSSPSSLENIQINHVVFENNAQGGVLAHRLIDGSQWTILSKTAPSSVEPVGLPSIWSKLRLKPLLFGTISFPGNQTLQFTFCRPMTAASNTVTTCSMIAVWALALQIGFRETSAQSQLSTIICSILNHFSPAQKMARISC